jgi:4-alpha-glucanotransferase
VALEASRAGAFVVGEDLGTVEPWVRDELAQRNVLSYRLLWFESDPPSRWPEKALAAVTTHDLPTVAGLWTGHDLQEQKALGLSPNEAGTREIASRVRRLTRATRRTAMPSVIAGVHAALGRAPSRVVTATLDDAMAVEDRPNMPATTAERANWCIPLPEPIESLDQSRLARRIARALRRRRPA